MEKVFTWRLHAEKSLLWAYGGHPVLPSSADLFYKQLQLLNFCELLWPTKTKSMICNKEKAESENPGMIIWNLCFLLLLFSVRISYYVF